MAFTTSKKFKSNRSSVPPTDVTVENFGSIYLFTPLNKISRDVFAKKLAEAQTFGIAVACEHRYAGQLVESLTGCGLILR